MDATKAGLDLESKSQSAPGCHGGLRRNVHLFVSAAHTSFMTAAIRMEQERHFPPSCSCGHPCPGICLLGWVNESLCFSVFTGSVKLGPKHICKPNWVSNYRKMKKRDGTVFYSAWRYLCLCVYLSRLSQSKHIWVPFMNVPSCFVSVILSPCSSLPSRT